MIDNVVLVVAVDPYQFATRPKKAAISYRAVASVHYCGLSAVGRVGHYDRPGRSSRDDIAIYHVPVGAIRTGTGRRDRLLNFLRYTVALWHLLVAALRVRADVVHVSGTPVVLVGLVHKMLYRSVLVVDVRERPGVVSSRGSLAATFSRFECRLLRQIARFVNLATVVVDADVQTMQGLGFQSVVLVRNAPRRAWVASYIPPPDRPSMSFEVVVVGSIFEGRGYELLIEALALVPSSVQVRIRVYGPGRADYLDALTAQTTALSVEHRLDWGGVLSQSEVSATYLTAHAGLVLYESADLGNDGLSNKILECVASGRPVIAGDLPANHRFVTENGVGWLAPVTAEGIAEALSTAARQGDFTALSARCRGMGDSWLNWESEFAKVISFLGLPASHGQTASTGP